MTKKRHWNCRTDCDHLLDFSDVWLLAIDEEEEFTSERVEVQNLLDTISKLLTDNRIDEAESFIESLNTEIDDLISIDFFKENVPELCEGVEIDTTNYSNQRNELREKLRENFEFDRSEVGDYFEEEAIDQNADAIYNKLLNVFEETAQEAARDEVSYDQLKDSINELNRKLSAPELREDYRKHLSAQLRSHLHQESCLNDEDLYRYIEDLSSELTIESWREKDFESLLRGFLTGTFETKEDRIDYLCEKVESLEENNTTIYVPIPEFPMELEGIEIDGITFSKRDSDEVDFDSRLSNSLFEDPSIKEDSQVFEKGIDIFASVEVKYDLSRASRRRAKERISMAFDVLNFGEDRGVIEPPFYDSHGSFYKETDSGELRPLGSEKTLPYMTGKEREDVTEKVQLFSSYFDRGKKTELQQNFRNSLRWHRYAVQSSESEEEFLKMVISLESLLVSGRGEEKSALNTRAVRLLQVLEEYKPQTERALRDMYETRSMIVHNAEYNIPKLEYQLTRLRNFSRRILSLTANYMDDCEDIDEVISKIEESEDEAREARIDRSPFEVGESFEVSGTLIQHYGGVPIGEVDIEGELKDDGRYVFYDSKIVAGEFKTDAQYLTKFGTETATSTVSDRR
ncbi:hypothetical protein GS429_06080 [Natronorubrum sp. JWXQ-INN-674]|uniref:Uncharacterized protein n=1 Tax=Natronorubrum halalkaliphilum TaxID=2691917 RepID=A0A6B0VJD2_9EURY|nr:HEPN domain-containing protein [Natronorubrum halalkaliphilum]MXV61638.1 hypothetical protein [Natronorubrum halalkaliphilum]